MGAGPGICVSCVLESKILAILSNLSLIKVLLTILFGISITMTLCKKAVGFAMLGILVVFEDEMKKAICPVADGFAYRQSFGPI